MVRCSPDDSEVHFEFKRHQREHPTHDSVMIVSVEVYQLQDISIIYAMVKIEVEYVNAQYSLTICPSVAM